MCPMQRACLLFGGRYIMSFVERLSSFQRLLYCVLCRECVSSKIMRHHTLFCQTTLIFLIFLDQSLYTRRFLCREVALLVILFMNLTFCFLLLLGLFVSPPLCLLQFSLQLLGLLPQLLPNTHKHSNHNNNTYLSQALKGLMKIISMTR